MYSLICTFSPLSFSLENLGPSEPHFQLITTHDTPYKTAVTERVGVGLDMS